MRKLPIVQSIPHGGLGVPEEVAGNLAIDPVTIYNECDLWVEQLFDFAHPDLADLHQEAGVSGSLVVVSMPMARVLIDVNRTPDDFANPDGPIKSQTSYGDAIYRQPLSQVDQAALAETHYAPFHRAVTQAMAAHAGQVHLFLDCHSMAQVSPDAYQFAGASRPLLCLCNFGDEKGNPRLPDQPTSCSAEFIQAAARLAEPLFGDMSLLEPQPGVEVPVTALNWPFWGGYVLSRYSSPTFHSPPYTPAGSRPPVGLMVEVNRGLYVGNQGTRTPIQSPNQQRIREIRRRLFQWILELVEL